MARNPSHEYHRIMACLDSVPEPGMTAREVVEALEGVPADHRDHTLVMRWRSRLNKLVRDGALVATRAKSPTAFGPKMTVRYARADRLWNTTSEDH